MWELLNPLPVLLHRRPLQPAGAEVGERSTTCRVS
jgi:hypothetical protein